MTIAYRDSAVASAGVSTLAIPADVQAGDLVLIAVDLWNSVGTLSATLASSGPTQPALQATLSWTAYSGGAQEWVTLWALTAAAGDPGATLTVTQTGTATGSEQFGLGAWSGAAIDAIGSGHTANGGEVASWTGGPTVTTTVNGDWVAWLGSDNNAGALSATPGTMRAGSGTRVGIADSNGSIGAAGTVSAAGTWVNTAGSSPWGAFAVALKASGAPSFSGTGNAALSLAASGPGSPARSGHAGAALALSASAPGASARSGSGAAAVSLLASAAGVPRKSGTGTAVIRLSALASVPAPAQKTGSWWGLVNILRQADQEFDAYRSMTPLACPKDSTPLKPPPNKRAGATMERYCPFCGWQYPRDQVPVVRTVRS